MQALTPDPALAPTVAAAPRVGEIVQSSQGYLDRHVWPAGRKLGQPCTVSDPWRGIVLAILMHEGKISALCGQSPVACRCHLDLADDEHPEASRPGCLDCRGEGEAKWRVRPLEDIERAPNPGPCRGLTRSLPR